MSTKKTVLAAVMGACLLFSMPALADDATPPPENDAANTPINQDNDNSDAETIEDSTLHQQPNENQVNPPISNENKANTASIQDKVFLYPANQTATVNENKILMPAAISACVITTEIPLPTKSISGLLPVTPATTLSA